MNKTLLTLSILITLNFTFTIRSQENKAIPAEKPKLIIGIIVSQMRYDYISRYWDKLDEKGIKMLSNRGVSFKNAGFNYIFSHEGVGQATIATGTNPSNHGIVSKEWYLQLKDAVVNNVEDKSYKTVGGTFDAGTYSPQNLFSTTFSDEIRLASNFKSKVISIALEPAHSILSAGHSANAAYWYDPVTGNFVTSTYYIDSLPPWVVEFNNKKLSDIYIDREWNTLLPITSYTESLPDDNKYETGLKGKKTFPYILKEYSAVNKKKQKYDILNTTPFGNNLTTDFAISAIVNEKLGKDDITDVVLISFTANEQIGNVFGPGSIEVEDAFLRLDKEIAHIIDFVEREVGKENTLIFFTSDHGVSVSPLYLDDLKIPSGYFNYNGAISLLSSALKNIYGKGDWIKSYYAQQIYLNRILIEDSKIPLDDFQNYVAQFLLQFEGVANTITASTLQSTNFTNGIFQKIQNSYNQKNSGDVIINLKPGWVEKSSGTTYHNTSYSYDSRVPLIWYGWKVGRNTIWNYTDLTDIAPTICTFLDIPYPNACTGEPILELVK